MKIRVFLLLIIFTIQCNNPQNDEVNAPIFNPVLLSALALDSIPSFWGNDSIYESSSGVILSSQAGYIDELVYKSNSQRWISVVVFSSRITAFAAMEYRIANVAVLFKEGNPADGKTWWYSDSSGSSIILSLLKYNTLVEAVRPGETFLFEEDSLWIPINDISDRIESLTE